MTTCRSCGASSLPLILDLGETPLANSLLTPEQLNIPEDRFPLAVVFCPECTLVQITETVPPEALFRDYVYFSSFSDTVLENARESVEKILATRALGPESLVVEIASNDGYLLKNFVAAGIPVLGVEPARNIAKVAEENGIPTVCEFFGDDLAEKLAAEGKQADVILANNVIAHIPVINGVMSGVKKLLKPGGAFIMETPYLRDLIDKLEFDTIYHEHLFYYSLTALEALYQRHGLAAADVEHLPIHGGTIRVTVVHQGEEGDRPAVTAMLAEEASWGVGSLDYYARFGRDVADLGEKLTGLLKELRSQGKTIAAYGAAAKGSTLVNAFGIGRDLIDFVVDRSTVKQGKLMPGVHFPILPPEALVERKPDYVLMLAWNFADEIIRQQTEYLATGGRFIVPVPTPRIVPAD